MLDWKSFKKPQRYMGNEWNVFTKSHHGKISFCLCFPDLYEIGMSNVGLRIIYGYLNTFSDVVCERVFMPDEDLYQYLIKHKKKLFSLESKTALSEFDVIGFNLSYELTFTNFLAMLSASGIPLRAIERPSVLVLGGYTPNPECLAEFVDVFFMGEFEAVVPAFIDVLKKYKDKPQRLQALSELEGFYVPQFYEITSGMRSYQRLVPRAKAKLPITPVYVKDLDNSYYPRQWLTPYAEIVHDRAQVEIARGCPNRCSFCQARCVYYPYRERSPERVFELMKALYAASGYENFSLLALSASNYSRIKELLTVCADYFGPKHVGVSLPSLRIEEVVGSLYHVLAKMKRVQATFAVEAATDTLRSAINKKIDINALFEAAGILKRLGARHIKLYFMFGFRDESDSDLWAVGDFLRRLYAQCRLKLNVSINAFIPKPFSYFEGRSMIGLDELERRRRIILSGIGRHAHISVAISDLRRTMLEAVIARSDRAFASVLYEAFARGARFDAYGERINHAAWDEAFTVSGIDKNKYFSSDASAHWRHVAMKACYETENTI